MGTFSETMYDVWIFHPYAKTSENRNCPNLILKGSQVMSSRNQQFLPLIPPCCCHHGPECPPSKKWCHLGLVPSQARPAKWKQQNFKKLKCLASVKNEEISDRVRQMSVGVWSESDCVQPASVGLWWTFSGLTATRLQGSGWTLVGSNWSRSDVCWTLTDSGWCPSASSSDPVLKRDHHP